MSSNVHMAADTGFFIVVLVFLVGICIKSGVVIFFVEVGLFNEPRVFCQGVSIRDKPAFFLA